MGILDLIMGSKTNGGTGKSGTPSNGNVDVGKAITDHVMNAITGVTDMGKQGKGNTSTGAAKSKDSKSATTDDLSTAITNQIVANVVMAGLQSFQNAGNSSNSGNTNLKDTNPIISNIQNQSQNQGQPLGSPRSLIP